MKIWKICTSQAKENADSQMDQETMMTITTAVIIAIHMPAQENVRMITPAQPSTCTLMAIVKVKDPAGSGLLLITLEMAIMKLHATSRRAQWEVDQAVKKTTIVNIHTWDATIMTLATLILRLTSQTVKRLTR